VDRIGGVERVGDHGVAGPAGSCPRCRSQISWLRAVATASCSAVDPGSSSSCAPGLSPTVIRAASSRSVVPAPRFAATQARSSVMWGQGPSSGLALVAPSDDDALAICGDDVLLVDFRPVDAGAAGDPVAFASARLDQVVAPAVDMVVSKRRIDQVVACAAMDDVVAGAAEDTVVAGAACDPVVAAPAIDDVTCRRGEDRVGPVCGDEACAGVRDGGCGAYWSQRLRSWAAGRRLPRRWRTAL
jgi:hypothetical protein